MEGKATEYHQGYHAGRTRWPQPIPAYITLDNYGQGFMDGWLDAKEYEMLQGLSLEDATNYIMQVNQNIINRVALATRGK